MVVLYDVDLYPYNTMRLHSIGKTMYVPECEDELISIIQSLKNNGSTFILLSGGSNIIFMETVFTPIINLMKVNTSTEMLPNGNIYSGCSVRIQNLIRFAQKHQKGGIEYLFSVPASVGGAVFMNAGRGRTIGKSISDHIARVNYLDIDEMTIRDWFDISAFSFRTSPFQKLNAIILGVEFSFENKTEMAIEEGIKERIAFSKQNLSADRPSCGSVFSIVNPVIIRLFRGQRVGGAMFVKKNYNWIVNLGDATASNIRELVRRVIKVHKFLHLKIKTELKFYQ